MATQNSSSKTFFLLCACFIVVRASILDLPTLIDPTEGRYALIGKHLLSQESWVMPQIDRGDGFEPFWGKPPLFFWLTGYAMKFLGPTTVASRLVSFVSSIGIVFFTFLAAKVLFSFEMGIIAAALLASSLTFFGLAGSCTIDVLLTLGTTAGMTFFVLSLFHDSSSVRRFSGYAAFISLALAMMTKGPIGVVFVVAPLFGWAILNRSLGELKKIPWLTGCLLFCLLTVPWFVIAEQASPGFLHYFFINEHVLRFTSAQYGDKYGTAHPSWTGKIWLLAAFGFIPWFFAFLPWSLRIRIKKWKEIFSPKIFLILLYFLCPLVFFTVAKTILFTYALPSFPALAILLAHRLSTLNQEKISGRLHFRIVEVFSVFIALGSAAYALVMHLPVAFLPAFLSVAALLACILILDRVSLSSVVTRASVFFFCSIAFGLSFLFEIPNQILSAKEVIDEASKVDPHFMPFFVDKMPYTAKFFAPENLMIRKIPQDQIAKSASGDYIYPSLKKVPLAQLAQAKTACQFGRWIDLDMDDLWHCANPVPRNG